MKIILFIKKLKKLKLKLEKLKKCHMKIFYFMTWKLMD
jgi:hypothetical protein